ncbi:MAG: SGNH/GDSL hydrolase family protein, partial [Planctomycetota bacterium]
MGWVHKIVVRASAVAIGLSAAGLGGEVLARARLVHPLPERLPLMEVRAHPTRGWEMVPSRDHFTYDKPVRVNALGLRGPEVEAKAPGELRVLALGDSMVYGQGVPEDGTLPHLLERRLEQHLERPVTVVNGGLRAYDTLLELALLEELGPAIDPDLVVLFWYGNDFATRDPEGAAARLERSGPIAFDLGQPAEGSAMLKWRLVQLARRSVLAMALQDARQRRFGDQRWLAAADWMLPKVPDWFDRFYRLCDQLGARGVVMVSPAG